MLHGPSRKSESTKSRKSFAIVLVIAPYHAGASRSLALDEQRGPVKLMSDPTYAIAFRRDFAVQTWISLHSPFRVFVLSRFRDTPHRALSPPCSPLALSQDNISLYILFDRCAMRIFKILLSHPVPRACSVAASRRGNCLCAKGLRRRFRTPEKYFSGELSNWSNPALFETAASAKPPLFQGVAYGD